MVIFLGVSLFMDVFKYFIDVSYHEGLKIVPIVLLANVFVGMLFNVNMWYKLTGHTIYGIFITGAGALITVVLNVIFIPLYSYFACAWIHLLTNFFMLIITYYFGQKFYKIQYDVKNIVIYICLGLLLFCFDYFIRTDKAVFNIMIGAILVLVYVYYCDRKENLIKIFGRSNENKNN
jgi:O-antigen/teichoic acid export membrane protein